jgi:hypothetical protein
MRSIAVVSLIILTLSLVSNCKKGVSQADLIVVTMTQAEWGLNYSSSMGHIEVILQGESVDGIILGSIEMKGDNPSAAPLKPESADFVSGNRVRALFNKNRVLALLANPAEGSIHIVILSFNTEPGNESFEVSTQVTVSNYVDDGGETLPLTLEIDPDEWSLNYTNSAGTVEAFIRGEGIDQIDLDSIEMVGDNELAEPLAAKSAAINNDHIHARFRKSQIIDLLSDPAPGSTHTIVVTYLFTDGTERQELSAIITIEDDDDILDPTELTLEIDPAVWNLNFFTDSEETVEAFIGGEGLNQIDLNSIVMTGDNLTAPPLAAISANIDGGQVHAGFPRNQVLDLLLDPVDGSTHTIIISFLPIGGTERIELTAVITIEDDIIDPEDLELEIDPDEWSLNFPKSSGTVEAFIEGEGIDLIDLTSIEMMGDNLDAAPLPALSATLKGSQIHARFPMNQVIDLLLDPEEGSTHTIIISFLPIGGTEEDRIELTAEITIEEDDDEEPEPSDLSLKIIPSTWNMNYYGSAGTVKAQIRGDGIEDIDLDTIELEGDNSSAEPLIATSAKLSGNHVTANFPKSQVLDLLSNPAKGTTHTVTVTFEIGGQSQELSAEVNIE